MRKILLFFVAILAFGIGSTLASSSSAELHPIAFVSDFNKQKDLWILDPSTGQDSRITNDSWEEESPSLNPAGDRVVYSFMNGGRSEIWIAETVTRNKKKLIDFKGDLYEPSWSPDGRKIVLVGDDGLYLFFLKDMRLTKIAEGMYESPSWLPGSAEIVTVRTKRESNGLGPMRVIEFVKIAPFQRKTALEVHGTTLDSPSALSEKDFIFVTSPLETTIIARPAAKGITRVISLPESVWGPCYSRDGRYIVFERDNGESSDLWMSNADGTGLRQLTRNHGRCYDPSW